MRGVQAEEAKGKVPFPRHLSQQSLQRKLCPEVGLGNNKPPHFFSSDLRHRNGCCVYQPPSCQRREREREREHHVDSCCVSRVVQPRKPMRQLCEAVSTTALRVQAKQQVCQIPLITPITRESPKAAANILLTWEERQASKRRSGTTTSSLCCLLVPAHPSEGWGF